MRQLIANAIDAIYRKGLRLGFGLRLRPARIRQRDLWTERNLVCEEIRQSVQATSAMMNRLALVDKEIVDHHAEMVRLKKAREHLRTPAPTQPIGDL